MIGALKPPLKGLEIVSLTYHEITEDPRVLKQARALRAAGHRVHVFCAWPKEKPRTETIDGIEITRFRAFAHDRVTRSSFAEVDYLSASRPAVIERMEPYLAAAEDVNGLLEIPGVKALLEDPRGKRELYRSKRGLRRVASRIRYHLFAAALPHRLESLHLNWAAANGQDASIPAGQGSARRGSDAMWRAYLDRHGGLRARIQEMRRAYRDLFQATGLVYAINLMRVSRGVHADVVHAHDIYCLPGGVCLAQALDAKLVYDAHEYEPARATRMPAAGPQIAEPLEDDSFRFVDRIITVSRSIGELYARRFSGPPPTIVMNAPEIAAESLYDAPAKVVPTLRELAGISETVPLLVFTGWVQKMHRGLDKVAEALVHLPDCHLVSLGPRHDANDAWLIDVAKVHRVHDRITLLPPVDARDVPATISSADVALCPFQDVSLNHRFAMPNKLFEAAFAQVPICVSDLPEMRNFVERLGIGRAMDQTDPAAIAAAIRDVLDHPSRFRLTEESKRLLVDEYSWAAQTRKLLALYEDLEAA